VEIRRGTDGPLERIAVTLGSFDGVHLGHRRLLARLVAMARRLGARSAVLTFDPHPRAVLTPGQEPPLLTTPPERELLLEEAGIDLIVRLRFDSDLAATSAEDFIVKRVLPLGDVVGFVVGYDFHFGKGRSGNAALLRALGERHGFVVEEMGEQSVGASPVKSTRIREAVAAGELDRAASFLGRPYSLRGRVVHGAGRGRALGYRTANIAIDEPAKLLPPEGVYAVRVRGVAEGGEAFEEGGVANLGVRPTFGGGPRVFEVHVFGGARDLYGDELTVDFIERLREERKFESAEALAAQIGQDVARARAVLQREESR
jgi:riboflavin kinase/FMN adenylyltransferase